MQSAEMKRGGQVGGEFHEDGGAPFMLQDTGTHIEEEKFEINIPRELLDDEKEYEFTGTNYEILGKILKKGGLSLSDKVTTVKSGDIVICIMSAWDDTKRTYKGKIRQILSAINESGGCKKIDSGATMTDHETGKTKKMDDGGTIPPALLKQYRNIAGVNKAIQKKYPKLIVVQGKGYLYWHSDDDKLALALAGLYSTSIPIAKASHQSIGTWLKEADELMEEIGRKKNPEYYRGGTATRGKLLAPNGKTSNLNKTQWHLVRTPEFKAWFGDWENDPKNASKVVDENGEPKVYQHSASTEYLEKDERLEIGEFKGNRIFKDEKTGEEVYPAWFFEKGLPAYASEEYSEQIYVFLNARNIFNPENKKDLIKLEKYSGNKFDGFGWIVVEEYNPQTPAQIKSLGYDAYISYEDTSETGDKSHPSIAIFSSTQIKLADGTNKTFDGSNPDIRYGEGGLLAPNGKSSNLNEAQWKLVRTPAFKKWFGDWENDPKNASKVVDENGEPLVVYHGSDSHFTVFQSKSKVHFFTDEAQVSKVIETQNTITAFLNLKNPYQWKSDGRPDPEPDEAGFRGKLIIEGYDGIIAPSNVGTADYIAFYPEQIKLADGINTTFDPNNPDMRYGNGGDTKNEKDNLKVALFSELPRNYQIAIIIRAYEVHPDIKWSIEKENIDWVNDKEVVDILINDYHKYFPTREFAYGKLPIQHVIDKVMSGKDIKTDWGSWEEYHKGYGYSAEHKEAIFPILVDDRDDEYIEDGWHRFHRYYDLGLKEIPVIKYLPQNHDIRYSAGGEIDIDEATRLFNIAYGGYSAEERLSADQKRSITARANSATKKLEKLLGFDIGSLPTLTQEQKETREKILRRSRELRHGAGGNISYKEKLEILYRSGGRMNAKILSKKDTDKYLKSQFKDYQKVNMPFGQIRKLAKKAGRKAQAEWLNSPEFKAIYKRYEMDFEGEMKRNPDEKIDWNGLNHLWEAQGKEERRLMKQNKYRTGGTEALPIFVRAGLPPKKKGKYVASTGHRSIMGMPTGKEWEESGVSVFDAEYFGKEVFIVADTGESESLTIAFGESSASGRPLYLVEGEWIGEGADGEPTLDPKTIKVIGQLDEKNVFNDYNSYAGFTYAGDKIEHPHKNWIESKSRFEAGGEIPSKPAYLMTLQEYQDEVAPILKEYSKFVRKNEEYLAKADYNGVFYYTFEALKEDMLAGQPKGHVFRLDVYDKKRKEYDKELTDEKLIISKWWRRKHGSFDNYMPPKPTPKDISDKNNEYINKLRQHFTEDEIVSKTEGDEAKSNKRSVKRAIDNGTYKKLLEEGELEISELEKISESVGVRLPKKIFDPSVIKAKERQDIYEKIYRAMPRVNKEKLMAMVEEIKQDIKPLEKYIYDTETSRYHELIEAIAGKGEEEQDSLAKVIPFWYKVFNVTGKDRVEYETYKDRYGREKRKEIVYYTGLSLKAGWKDVVHNIVLEYIESLKASLLYAIVHNFEKITLPIKSIEKIHVGTGKGRKFEGSWRFEFENGGRFFFKTDAIGAGGYNIQIYHLRYLTNFTNVTLPDGSKLDNPHLTNIVLHFSESSDIEKRKNPYMMLGAAESTQEIIDGLYEYLKTGNVKDVYDVRKSPTSISYRKGTRLGRYSSHFTKPPAGKELMDTDEAKAKALKLLEGLGVKRTDKFEHGGTAESAVDHLVTHLYKEHHEAFDFANNICNGEESAEQKAERVLHLWDSELKHHFEQEERYVFPMLACNPRLKPLVIKLLEEHCEFDGIVDRLRSSNSQEAIDKFCSLLKEHIMSEEDLFSSIMPDPYKFKNAQSGEIVVVMADGLRHTISATDIGSVSKIGNQYPNFAYLMYDKSSLSGITDMCGVKVVMANGRKDMLDINDLPAHEVQNVVRSKYPDYIYFTYKEWTCINPEPISSPKSGTSSHSGPTKNSSSPTSNHNGTGSSKASGSKFDDGSFVKIAELSYPLSKDELVIISGHGSKEGGYGLAREKATGDIYAFKDGGGVMVRKKVNAEKYLDGLKKAASYLKGEKRQAVEKKIKILETAKKYRSGGAVEEDTPEKLRENIKKIMEEGCEFKEQRITANLRKAKELSSDLHDELIDEFKLSDKQTKISSPEYQAFYYGGSVGRKDKTYKVRLLRNDNEFSIFEAPTRYEAWKKAQKWKDLAKVNSFEMLN